MHLFLIYWLVESFRKELRHNDKKFNLYNYENLPYFCTYNSTSWLSINTYGYWSALFIKGYLFILNDWLIFNLHEIIIFIYFPHLCELTKLWLRIYYFLQNKLFVKPLICCWMVRYEKKLNFCFLAIGCKSMRFNHLK